MWNLLSFIGGPHSIELTHALLPSEAVLDDCQDTWALRLLESPNSWNRRRNVDFLHTKRTKHPYLDLEPTA